MPGCRMQGRWTSGLDRGIRTFCEVIRKTCAVEEDGKEHGLVEGVLLILFPEKHVEALSEACDAYARPQSPDLWRSGANVSQ